MSEIDELKAEEKEKVIEIESERDRKRRRKARSQSSLFGPILLIGMGSLLLLSNFGAMPALNWTAALSLWPLLLILWGVSLVSGQLRRPLGSIATGTVGLITLALFANALLSGNPITTPALPVPPPAASEVVFSEQAIELPLNSGVNLADIEIDIGAFPLALTTSSDDAWLMNGVSTYDDEIEVVTEAARNGREIVRIKNEPRSGWFLDPNRWRDFSRDVTTSLAINDSVPVDLKVDLGSGRGDLALGNLSHESITVDAGSGAVSIELPGGVHETKLDFGSGASDIALTSAASGDIEIDSGSGAVRLSIPAQQEVRIEIDTGSGGINVSDNIPRIDRGDDDQIYQTDGYQSGADNSLLIKIDSGSGSVTVSAENQTGR